MIAKCDKCGAKNNTPAEQYQNERYGNGQRVHNECKGGKFARCVCCGNERSAEAKS